MFEDKGDSLRQGDLVKSLYFPQLENKLPAICLTPICDLVSQPKKGIKADYVLFAPIFPDKIFFKQLSKREKVDSNKIKKIIAGSYPRYYWIYNNSKSEGYVIDYQVVHSIKYSEAVDLELTYSLKSSFKERIASGYSAYMGRIGTESLDYKSLAESLDTAIKA